MSASIGKGVSAVAAAAADIAGVKFEKIASDKGTKVMCGSVSPRSHERSLARLLGRALHSTAPERLNVLLARISQKLGEFLESAITELKSSMKDDIPQKHITYLTNWRDSIKKLQSGTFVTGWPEMPAGPADDLLFTRAKVARFISKFTE